MRTKCSMFLAIICVVLLSTPSSVYARGEGEFIGSLLIGILIVGVIFLILREVVCWYWKINQQIGLLTEIRDLLAKNSRNVSQNHEKTDGSMTYDDEGEVSEEEILRELDQHKGMSDYSADELVGMGVVPKDTGEAKADEVYDDNMEEMAEKYEKVRESIRDKLKKNLTTEEELKILASMSRLSYYELTDMGTRTDELSDKGLDVYRLLMREVELQLQ